MALMRFCCDEGGIGGYIIKSLDIPIRAEHAMGGADVPNVNHWLSTATLGNLFLHCLNLQCVYCVPTSFLNTLRLLQHMPSNYDQLSFDRAFLLDDAGYQENTVRKTSLH